MNHQNQGHFTEPQICASNDFISGRATARGEAGGPRNAVKHHIYHIPDVFSVAVCTKVDGASSWPMPALWLLQCQGGP